MWDPSQRTYWAVCEEFGHGSHDEKAHKLTGAGLKLIKTIMGPNLMYICMADRQILDSPFIIPRSPQKLDCCRAPKSSPVELQGHIKGGRGTLHTGAIL